MSDYSSKVVVRRATRLDIPRLIDLGEEFYQALNYPRPLSLARSLALVGGLISSDTGYIAVATTHRKTEAVEEHIFGAFLGAIIPGQFTDESIAHELGIWASEDHRGQFPLRRMLRDFENWAEQLKADGVALSFLTHLKPEVLEAVYGKLGYKAVEVRCVKHFQN